MSALGKNSGENTGENTGEKARGQAGFAKGENAGQADDSFELYDLKIEVIAGDQPMVCDHRVGEYFYLQGEMIIFPPEGRQRFPLYPLAALLPLLPAKQRPTHPHDWMTTDAEIACPDPYCGARFLITRLEKRRFSHAETTRVPLPGNERSGNEKPGKEKAR